MVMPEEVIPEPALLPHLLQEVRELVRPRPFPEQLVLDAGGSTVGDNVAHFPICPLEVSPRFQIFFFAGQFLFPPGAVVDPEWRTFGFKQPELSKELGIVRLQDAALDIMAAGPTHGKDPLAAQLKDLAALQQEHGGADAPDLPAAPVLQRIGPQGIVVFVVP